MEVSLEDSPNHLSEAARKPAATTVVTKATEIANSATASLTALLQASSTASATSTSAVVSVEDSLLHLDLVSVETVASAAVLVLAALAVVVVILAKQVEVTLAQPVVATVQVLLEPMEATSHHFEKQQTR